MSDANEIAKGPLRPEEKEAIFVRDMINQFIEDYVIETEKYQLEEFDLSSLAHQKAKLSGSLKYQPKNYGYRRSDTLQGATKAAFRLVGMRTHDNARMGEKFITARRKFVIDDKKYDISRDKLLRQYLSYKPGDSDIPEGGRVYFLTYLNNLPVTTARNLTMLSLSDSGKYEPDKTLSFEERYLFPFSLKRPYSVTKYDGQNRFVTGLPDGDFNGGKRRNKITRRVRRNKGKKTRRN